MIGIINYKLDTFYQNYLILSPNNFYYGEFVKK